MAVHGWDALISAVAAIGRVQAVLYRKSASMLRYPATVLVALAVLVPAMHASPASARTVHGTYGGTGDASVVDECSPRRYLVGVRVRVGAWMDQIQIICQLRGRLLSTSSPTSPWRNGRRTSHRPMSDRHMGGWRTLLHHRGPPDPQLGTDMR